MKSPERPLTHSIRLYPPTPMNSHNFYPISFLEKLLVSSILSITTMCLLAASVANGVL
jgi:hypothetical protein